MAEGGFGAAAPATRTPGATIQCEVDFEGTKPANCAEKKFNPACAMNVTPVIEGFTPGRGPISNSIPVTVDGVGFGSNPSLQVAGSGVTVSVSSRSDTEIQATFAIGSSATPGNHGVTVTNTSVVPNQVSGSQNWFVQIPGRLARSTVNDPPGYGPLQILDPAAGTSYGPVLDINGQVLLSNQCGTYRNLAYAVYDQDSPEQLIYGGYTLNEAFTPKTGCCSQPTAHPAVVPLNYVYAGDNIYIGHNAPTCLGSNDNQSFSQSFSVKMGSTSYPVTLTNSITRGRFSGNYEVNVTITAP